jgi:hypothetical protein
MSTPQTQDAYANLKGLPQPKIQELPQIALTGRITKVGDPVVTREGEGDYDSVELTIEPTNGSRKISFIRMFIRPEYFSFGQLDPEEMYVKNPKNPYFSAQKEGSDSKPKTNGESFAGSFGMNVMPSFATDKEGNVRLKDGKPYVRRITPVMAIAGGTLEGFNTLVGLFKEFVAKNGVSSKTIEGITEITPQQIVNLLNEFLQSQPAQELVFTAKQGSRNGELTDNYEFNQFEGPLNAETHQRLVNRAEKTKDQTGSKKLVIRYSV